MSQGSAYFIYGAYRDTPTLNVSMGAIDLGNLHNGDGANDDEFYIARVDFVNDDGQSTINWNMSGGSGGKGAWSGIVVTGIGGSGFDSWKLVNGATGGLADDHDDDGVENGVEYFIGGPNGNTTGFTAMPGVTRHPITGALSVTWTKAADYAGAFGTDFFVETSDTLTGTWTDETSTGNVTVTGTDAKFTFPTPLGAKKFARLRVTGP